MANPKEKADRDSVTAALTHRQKPRTMKRKLAGVTRRSARKNVVRMAQHYIDYCASYGTKCSFYEYCEPDIPMTTETKELIAKVSDSLHDVVSTLGK